MSDLLDNPVRRGRMIDWLRKKYPAEKWSYVNNHGVDFWVTESGWSANYVSFLAPQFDGDDDSFTSRFYLTVPGENPVELYCP